jgi:hypothetical protein
VNQSNIRLNERNARSAIDCEDTPVIAPSDIGSTRHRICCESRPDFSKSDGCSFHNCELTMFLGAGTRCLFRVGPAGDTVSQPCQITRCQNRDGFF